VRDRVIDWLLDRVYGVRATLSVGLAFGMGALVGYTRALLLGAVAVVLLVQREARDLREWERR